nr:hypothetical protein [Tanacetum cinerariifolium]
MSNTNNTIQNQTSNSLHKAIMEAGGKDRPPMLASVDAFPNACEMWKAIKRLKQVNEISDEKLARTANPLALVAQQQPVYHPQKHPTHNTQNDSTRSQQATTKNRGKAIVNSPPPKYDQEPTRVAEDDEMSKDKEIDKLMALISLSFKKIYKPTNNNLRTSSNTSSANQDNSRRINRGTVYDNQRIVNVAGARENVETKMGKGCSLSQGKDVIELEAHYMYMAQIQEATPDVADNSGPIFDSEPLQKVKNNDNYNVFANESEHPEQSNFINDTYPIEQDKRNVIIDSLDMSYDREQLDQDDDDLANECDLFTSLIEKLKCEMDDSKKRNKFLEISNKALVDKLKGSTETTNERYVENYKNVSQDIRDQLNTEAAAIQIILTRIDNDIYSTVDAFPNACEMWKAIKR